jgi:hypothetical protein
MSLLSAFLLYYAPAWSSYAREYDAYRRQQTDWKPLTAVCPGCRGSVMECHPCAGVCYKQYKSASLAEHANWTLFDRVTRWRNAGPWF